MHGIRAMLQFKREFKRTGSIAWAQGASLSFSFECLPDKIHCMPSLERYIDIVLIFGSLVALIPICVTILHVRKMHCSSAIKIFLGIFLSAIIYFVTLTLLGMLLSLWL